jgi:hypothetical protein
MNTKSLLLAASLSLGLLSASQAQIKVYMTGSTAGRSAVYATIMDGATVFDSTPTFVGQGTTVVSPAITGAPEDCKYMMFTGQIGGNDVILKCTWSGSEGGIGDLVGANSQKFLLDSATTVLDGSAPNIDATVNAGITVELAAADNSVTFSKNPAAALQGDFVAIIPFKFLKQRGSKAGLLNVTSDAFKRIASTGYSSLALLTGGSTADDEGTRVYLSGRDNNSGTRVNALAITGYGIKTLPRQVTVNSAGVVSAPGLTTGYSSGGALATQLGIDLAQTSSVDPNNGNAKFSVIAYVGMADAGPAEQSGAVPLSYNGVPFSIQAIREGQYGFWGNYYVYGRPSVSTSAQTILNKLIATTGVNNHADDTVLIKKTSMHASRSGPTTAPQHNP